MKINNKSYKALPMSFNTICELEALGVDLTKIESNYMQTMRAYLSLCMKCSLEDAGKELEKHFINGGDLDEFSEEFQKAVEQSGFFQALQTPTTKTTAKSKKTSEK